MAPSIPQSAFALIEVKPDRLGSVALPLDRGDLFLLRIDGEAEILAPRAPDIGRRYRVFIVPATTFNQRLVLGPCHVIPAGRRKRIDIFGCDMARLEFEIAGVNKQGHALTLVSGFNERWPKACFEFGQ